VLVTLLCTEIVGARALAAHVGDVQWRTLLDEHDRVVQQLLLRYRGREERRSVSGFLATFDGPARAIECASALTERLASLICPFARVCTRAKSKSAATTSMA